MYWFLSDWIELPLGKKYVIIIYTLPIAACQVSLKSIKCNMSKKLMKVSGNLIHWRLNGDVTGMVLEGTKL